MLYLYYKGSYQYVDMGLVCAAYTASPRLTSLERKQAKLQHKQKEQEQQLDKQKQMYLSVSMRLKQTAAEAMQQSTPDVNEMGSLLQESLSKC